MANKMDEEQTSFLDELLGGTPAPADTPPEETVPGEVAEEVLEPTEVADGSSTEPAPEVSGEAAPAADAPEDVNAILREQIVKLTEQLNKDPMIQTVQEDPAGKEEFKKEDKKKLEAFLTDEEMDRIIDEPQLLNVAFNRAIGVMQQNMQSVIQAEVNRQVIVSKAVSDFYTTNQDLAPYGKFVQFVMAEVEKSNPDKTYADIFEITASETRKRLGLTGSATKEVSRSSRDSRPVAKQKPAFAGSKHNSQRPAGKQEWFDPNAADLFDLS